ncbi:MAG: peroxidase family protein, partial [Verrucomicrobiales bacterium]
VRRIDGYGNNENHPERGMAVTHYRRLVPAGYADGVSEPSGANLPSARAISNAVAAQSESRPNAAGASDFVWQWGQFIDHDLDETPTVSPAEAFDIAVPAGDPFFDPGSSGTATIGLNRSDYELVDGVRQQINEITAYIDASNVYGSDEERAFALRLRDGSGRLATSEGELLPLNTEGLANAPTSFDPSFFLAGDVRANEQAGLTAMHTVFVREHNHWATTMREANPRMSGEEIYQASRAMVAAELQAITYREFLPVLLGEGAIPPYRGYRDEVDASISNVFAAAAYRLGHSMLSEELLCLDSNMEAIDSGSLPLLDSFFDPTLMTSIGPDPILRGLCVQQCQELDNEIVDGVRNFLFGAPGSGGFDLASLNIQRGRDHGLPSYNGVREAYGLPAVSSFSEINPDPSVVNRLSSVYVSPDDIDPWVGMLAEQHVEGAMVGETHRAVLADQFRRLRDGDRFWYQNYLKAELAQVVEEQTLARIIRRNTGVGDEIPEDVFRVLDPQRETAGRNPVRRR